VSLFPVRGGARRFREYFGFFRFVPPPLQGRRWLSDWGSPFFDFDFDNDDELGLLFSAGRTSTELRRLS
jgi:hypothetical protein